MHDLFLFFIVGIVDSVVNKNEILESISLFFRFSNSRKWILLRGPCPTCIALISILSASSREEVIVEGSPQTSPIDSVPVITVKK